MSQKTNFSILLKHYRQNAGLSQEALAARAGLSIRAISDLERGINRTPRFKTLEALAPILSLSAQQLALLRAAARPGLKAANNSFSEISQFNLPVPSFRLLGRDQERLAIMALLGGGSTRLLTLTGPSGVGKTRLALDLTGELTPKFADGAVYIPLAVIRDPELVPREIAQVLGLAETNSASPVVQLVQFLRPKHFLLVLDNLEQVLECGRFIADLLERCPRLYFLVTSRTPLHLGREQEFRLAPLLIEDAVALFCERVQSLRPAVDLDLSKVKEICQKVDCLPLAIELVAIQAKILPLFDLHENLNRRLALLVQGAKDLPLRQQTMEEAINWSYELLTPQQQQCFRALSVFSGGWTLEAALAVCKPEPEIEADEKFILRLIHLVDASLVQVNISENDSGRFSMLEMIREFALQRLRTAGEEEHYRYRHAAYFARLAENVINFFGPEQEARNVQFLGLVHNLPNARAALEWAEEREEAELGLRLTGFARLWHVRGQLSEVIHWMERMLALDKLAREQGKPVAALTHRIEKLYGVARTIVRYGHIDRLEKAQAFATEALRLAQDSGNQKAISDSFATLGMIAQAKNELDIAEEAFMESYKQASLLKHKGLTSRALSHLGNLACRKGQLIYARDFLQQALAIARSAGMNWDVALTTTMLGHLSNQQQLFGLARTYFREALILFRLFESPGYTARCLEGFAATLYAQGQPRQAARLCAAASEMRRRSLIFLLPSERESLEQLVAAIKATLDEPTFISAWQAGSALTHDEAVDIALAEADRQELKVTNVL
jgi:predicted ATPase/transcriptional regulator with XRE-family HTH domain